MKKNSLVLLLAALAGTAAAEGFDSGADVSALVGRAREAAAAMPSPTVAPASWWPGSRSVDADALLARARNWPVDKIDARQALDTLIEAMARENPDAAAEWRQIGVKVWTLAESVEEQQEILYARASARVGAEEKDAGKKIARLTALQDVLTLRKYAVYGNMIPRVIDEAVQDRRKKDEGRLYAGPTWHLDSDWKDLQAAGRALVSRTGFSESEFEKMGKTVADEYKASHPDVPK